jgi:hypothetical protein
MQARCLHLGRRHKHSSQHKLTSIRMKNSNIMINFLVTQAALDLGGEHTNVHALKLN